MKKTIKDSLRHLPGIVATLFLLAAAACMPESFKPGIDTPGSQDRSPMTLELGISSPESSVRTRADESGPMQDSTINSIWIGVFDIETGDLVGQTTSNRTQGETEKYPYRTAKVDILYYDAHPQVRIFGVANYGDVKARRTKETSCNTPLGTLLSGVENITDFLDISVEAKEPDNSAPLMMGVYTHTSINNTSYASGLYAVDINDNSELHTFNPITDIELNKLNPNNPEDGKYDRIKYADIRTNGQIRLRRLVSQINVTVVPGQSSDKTVELSNMSYRRVNLPKEVYLQERQTKEFESSWDATDWGKQTPNKADVLVNYDTGNSALGYESDTDFKAFNSSFTFYQYENKHWGTADNQSDREEVRKGTDVAGNPVFTALCGKEENGTIYNNYASYFEINVDVAVTENGKTQNANVTYRIHEGYCNDIDGNKVKDDPNDPDKYNAAIAKDFTCVRNTIYNYTITISGLTSITVTEGEHNHTNPGVLGNAVLWTNEETFEMNAEEGEGTKATLKETEIVGYICYYENGGDPMWYGAGDYMPLLSSPALPDLENAEQIEDPSDAGFSFTIGGQNIANLFPATKAEAENSAVTIGGIIKANNDLYNGGNPKNYFHSLYLLKPIKYYDNDGCTQYPYYCIHFQPKDGRDVMPNKFDFSLAFANEWDSETTAANGAVAGHIKDIRVLDPEWDTPPDAEKITFTVYVDDEKVADSIEDLDNISICTSLKNDGGNSIHTVKVVAITDEYQDAEFEKEFVVYPTEFEWDYSRSSQIGENIQVDDYFGDNTHLSETDIFAKITHAGGNMNINKETSLGTYLQTRGQRTLTVTALYDAILTVVASNTGSAWATDRFLSVSSGNETIPNTYAGSPKPTQRSNLISYTFYVKKGEVTITTSQSLNIYSVKLSYLDPAANTSKLIWDFSQDKWKGTLDYISSKKTQFSLSMDGLTLLTDGSELSASSSNSYIGLGGAGNTNKRVFSFIAHKSGTVVITIAAGGTDGRYMCIQVGDNSPKPLDTITTTNKISQTCEITITEPTPIYIYSGYKGISVYSIAFQEN